MSQEQPGRGAEDKEELEAIKYGEVFNVSGALASKPIAPRDAATMQSAETQALGHTQKGGPAALMESAAAYNQRAGLVTHHAVTHLARNEGVTVSETKQGGNRLITETVGGQVVGQYVQPADEPNRNSGLRGERGRDAVNQGTDATSMQPPEFKATQDIDFIGERGGAGATLNPRFLRNQDNNDTFSYVSSGKRETGEGGDNVTSGTPGGVGASMATADHRVTKNK